MLTPPDGDIVNSYPNIDVIGRKSRQRMQELGRPFQHIGATKQLQTLWIVVLRRRRIEFFVVWRGLR
jgi:hypothetical protein